MTQQTKQIPVSSIILDEDIYPRKGINHRRVGIFSENIRDGFKFDPIEVEPCPDKPGWYRLLEWAHRWSAFKSTGVEEIKAIIKNLDGNDPLLYAATKAIGPKQLMEDEARDTAKGYIWIFYCNLMWSPIKVFLKNPGNAPLKSFQYF